MLLSLVFKFNVKLFYMTNEGLVSQLLYSPAAAPQALPTTIQLYLNPDGNFDVLYDKGFIKSAGICQSILLETLDKLLGAVRPHAAVYQNVEFQLWKDRFDRSIPLSGMESLSLVSDKANGDGSRSRSPVKKMASDSSVSTPALLRQIRSYLSLSPEKRSDCSCFKSAVDTLAQANASSDSTTLTEPQQGFRPGSEETKVRLPLPIYAKSESQQQYAAPTYLVQTPTQYYLPVMVQPTVQDMTYGYSPYTAGEYMTGRIKFFDEGQNYGFFVLDCDGSDLFVHYDDLVKAGITKEVLRLARTSGSKFAFRCMKYYGKYDMSYKAVDIQLLEDVYPTTTAAYLSASVPTE